MPTLYCRDATGKFPDYPDEEAGGSAAILNRGRSQILMKTTMYINK